MVKIPKYCTMCKKLIIKDFDKWKEENEGKAYIQCPYCFHLERID